MKLFITIVLTIALFWLPPIATDARPDPPPIVPSAYVAVIALIVGGVLFYGIYKMSQGIPPDGNPPPTDTPPGMQLPPPGGVYIFRVPPKLSVGYALLAEAEVSVQHQDVSSGLGQRGDGQWQTDYRFRAVQNGGSLSLVAYDAMGRALMTNTPTMTYQSGGNNWQYFDFSILPPTVTNLPPQRFFRLLAQ